MPNSEQVGLEFGRVLASKLKKAEPQPSPAPVVRVQAPNVSVSPNFDFKPIAEAVEQLKGLVPERVNPTETIASLKLIAKVIGDQDPPTNTDLSALVDPLEKLVGDLSKRPELKTELVALSGQIAKAVDALQEQTNVMKLQLQAYKLPRRVIYDAKGRISEVTFG